MIGGLAPVLLLLLFSIAAVAGSRALRLSPVVGYLVLGVVLSASGLGTLVDTGVVGELAELGVVFLLFDVGLHFSPRHVREHASDIFGFGPVQVVFGTLGLGGLALLCGLQPGPALLWAPPWPCPPPPWSRRLCCRPRGGVEGRGRRTSVMAKQRAGSFKGRHFTSEVILWALRWYLAFPVSFRDLACMLADRGVEVDYTDVPP